MLEELLVIFMQGIRCIYNHLTISHIFCTCVHYEQSSQFQCSHQQDEKVITHKLAGLCSTSHFTYSIYLYTT